MNYYKILKLILLLIMSAALTGMSVMARETLITHLCNSKSILKLVGKLF